MKENMSDTTTTPVTDSTATADVASATTTATVTAAVTAAVVTAVADAPVAQASEPTVVDAPVAASGTVAMNASSTVGSGTTEPAAPAVSLDERLADTKLKSLGVDQFSPECQKLITQILTTGSSLAAGTLTEVLTYVVNMSPKRAQTQDTAGAEQVRFYRVMQYIYDQAPADFQLFFATFLRIVYESRNANGAFHPMYAFRALPSINLGPDDRRAFQNLMHLYGTLCDASTRIQSLKQIDLIAALKYGLKENGRQRILSFFTA